MARTPRTQLVDLVSTNHCTWRSHNKEAIFEDPAMAELFLSLLARYKRKFGILIHSFCLMGTHPHVVITSTLGQTAFSQFWQVVNHCFAWHYNRAKGRRGQVVMDRVRSPMVQPDGRHLLTVMRYGDLNPVRAGLVESAKDWRYSSFRHYAHGDRHPLIDDAPDYLALGESPRARRLAYQNLFADKLAVPLLRQRRDLVLGPFIGHFEWCASRLLKLRNAAPSG